MNAFGEARNVRILLADDHTLLREAMRELLGYESDFEVVGEASDGVEAVETAGRLRPDVVLLDVEMPHNVPTETVRGIRLLAALPRDHADRARRAAARAGHGRVGGGRYLHKSIGRNALTAAIRGAIEASGNGAGRRLVMSVTHGSLMADQPPTRLISPRSGRSSCWSRPRSATGRSRTGSRSPRRP